MSPDDSMLLKVHGRIPKPLASQFCYVLPRPKYLDLPHVGVPAILMVGQDRQLYKARLEIAPAPSPSQMSTVFCSMPHETPSVIWSARVLSRQPQSVIPLGPAWSSGCIPMLGYATRAVVSLRLWLSPSSKDHVIMPRYGCHLCNNCSCRAWGPHQAGLNQP